MAKNTGLYVLDNTVVVEVLKAYDGQLTEGSPLDTLLNSITEQMPPLPTGLGAVVELSDDRVAVRTDNSALPWRTPGEEGNPGEGEWFGDDDLPRPFKVLSRGLDL